MAVGHHKKGIPFGEVESASFQLLAESGIPYYPSSRLHVPIFCLLQVLTPLQSSQGPSDTALG